MSEKPNATCSICGKKYRVCNVCKETKILKPWRTITDEIECYKIYMIIHDYTYNKINKEQAYEMLKERNLPSELQDHVKTIVNEIMETNKKNKKEGKKVVLDNNPDK